MGSLTHIAARTAAGIGIDQTLKKVSRGDRETELLKLIDLMEKYVAGSSIQVNGDAYRNLIKDENSALSRYINRALDEVDHNVLRTTVLNFGFEAMLNGTMTIRKMREVHGAVPNTRAVCPQGRQTGSAARSGAGPGESLSPRQV